MDGTKLMGTMEHPLLWTKEGSKQVEDVEAAMQFYLQFKSNLLRDTMSGRKAKF